MKPTGAGFPVPHRDRLRAGHHARVRRGRLLAVAVASSALAVGLGLPALFPGASAGPPWNAWAAADTGGGNGGDDVITLLDLPNPDAATNEALLGTGTGTTGIRGLAVQPSTGVLFGATTDRLGVVSPITGEFTAVGSGFGSGTGSMGIVGFDNVQGIAFDDSGRLFAVHEKSGDDPLFEVDPVSGTRVAGAFGADDYLTLESSATAYSWMQDLAIDPISGGAFAIVWDGSAHYKLATADLVTGSLAMPDATLDAAEPHGLSFDTAGQAWAIGSPGAGGVVAPVDKAAGTLGALIAIDDAGSYQALAFIPPNSAPAFDQDLGDRTDAEGGAVSLASPATDPEGDTLIWSATGLPGGLSVDPSTGQISGTIDFTAAAASPYSTEIRVEDPSGGFDLDTFTWTVTDAPAPRPPVFDQDLGDRSDIEGTAVSASAPATDPDGDPLTYSATGLPPGLSIHAGTGIISGTVGIGAAAGSPYSTEVRATDPGGLFATDTFTWSVTDGSIVFQQGAAGYSGFQDTGLWQHAPGTARGNETYLTIDQLESGASSETQGLIQFLDIVGTGPGHIPPGSTVVSASLQVYVIDPSPGSISFHPMISAWDESATWNGLGNGIQPDGVEAGVTPEVVFGATGTTGQRTIAGFENSVQAWVDGTSPNRGWALFNDSEDGWDFDSSEYGEEARRPRLLVDFTPNAGPVFALNLGDRADAEGAVISLSSAATDPEGHGITYSATGLPPGLGIDTGSGLISGTIALTAAPGSPYAVQVTATDDYGVASGDTFTWTITDTNEAPSVVNPGNRSNNENQIVTFVVAGSDPDGDSLTWSATGLPDGLTIDPASGVISGTLSYVSAGVHAVTVRATDPGLLFDEAGFTWTVADVNQGPQVVHPGSQTVAEGDAVSMVMTATDPDGDGFTWSATGLPAGLSIDPVSGLLSGTVDWGAASGSPYNSTITATDDGTPPASGAALVDWTVSDTNRAPAVTNPGNQTSAEGDPVSLPIVGNDPDGDTLTWSATGLPPGLSIDTGSGTVSGIVDFSAAAGSPHAVVVTATDNGIPVQAAQAAFTWAVTDVNRNPVVTDPGDQTDAEGDAVLVTVTGLDPDGDTLTWSAAGLPPGLSIDPASGDIFGTLTFASSGTHPVAVRATDDGAGSLFDEVAFTWSVASTNRPPVVTDPGAQADAEGDVISLPMAAADPDGDDLTWSASGLPDGLSIGPATGVIGGAIGYAAAAGSPFTVTVRVTDDGVPAAFDEVVFEWSVADVNRAPTVASPGDQAGAEGEVVNVPVAGADPDGDPVWWSAAGLPQGLGIDTETGELVGSIAYSAAEDSPFLVTVRMTDQGGLFGEASFAWSVSNTPTVIDIAKASDVVGRAQPGDTVVYTVVVTNPESTPATGVMVSDPVPAGTGYVPGSGSYSMVDAARDSFESGGYQGDDGTIPWSGPWVELDGAGLDATKDGVVGSPFCAGGSCLFVNPDFASGIEGMERPVDLSGRASATLTYRVSRSSGGGSVGVRVRGNGQPWTTLATYTLTVDDPTAVAESFDISAFAGADTMIRLEALVAGGGKLYVDDVAVVTGMLTAAAGPPPGMVSGITLAPGESVTVSFSVEVSDPPPGSGTISNAATVVSLEEPGGVSDAVSDPVNRYPVFLQDLGDRADPEGTTVSLAASATDPDGDARTWSATGLPAGLSIDPATGLISGTIGFDAAPGSPYSVLVTVEDVDGLGDLDSFTWTVSNTNRPPVVVDPGTQSDAEADAVWLAMAGSDPDGNGLSWSATGLPDGLAIDPSTGVISGSPSYDASAGSPYAVTVRATDDGVPVLFADVVFIWDVADTNRPPEVTGPGPQSTPEGDSVQVMVTASDPDGDGFTWTASGLPAGLSIDPATGEISGDVTFAASGGSPYTVTVTATDDGVPAEAGSAEFDWTITATNRAPTVANPGAQSSLTGESVSMPMSATDPDGDTFTWAASGLPTGLSIDPSTGTISGTVTAPATTVFTVEVSVTDDGVPAAVGQVAFMWVIADDLAITKVSDAGGSAAMGQTLTYTVTVADPGPSTHTGVAITDALPPGTTWLSTQVAYPIDGTTGTAGDGWETQDYAGSTGTIAWLGPWVETNDDGSPSGGKIHLHRHDGVWLIELEQGEKWITRTTDLSGYSSAEVSYRFRRHGLKDSGDVIVVEISPDGAVWTEIARHAGPGDDDWQVKAPIDITDYLSATTSIRFRSLATHNDGELRVDWVEITATQRVTATGPGGPPPNLVSGITLLPGESMTAEVVVRVDDPLDRAIVSIDNTATVTSDQQVLDALDATSDAVNHGPLFDQNRGDRSDAENAPISLPNPATDPNGDLLAWSAVGLPDGLSIDPSTGLVSGTITFDAAAGSPFAVTLRVEDPAGVLDQDTFVWTVTNTNRAPLVASPGDQSGAEADVVWLAIAGSDPDGNGLTWSAAGLPGGLSIDAGSGVVSGSISYDASPSSPFTVTVRATDDGIPVLFSEKTFIWTVSNTNRGPVVVDPGAQNGAEADVVSLAIAGSDPDGNGLTWSAAGLPGGLSIDAGTGVVSGSISYDASPSSPFTVTVRATDDGTPVLFAERTFIWAVADTNRAPTVIDPAAQSGAEGDGVSLAMAATDPDLDTLTWTAFNLPPGLVIGSASGVISGTPTYDAAGTYTVIVRATDDRVPFLSDEVIFTWTVTNTNRAPIIVGPGNQSGAEGDVIGLAVSGFDPDGNTLTWSATGLPGGLSIDPGSGVISGVVSYDTSPSSPFTVTVRVVDDGTPQLSQTVVFTWLVADTNRPPVLVSPGDRANGESDVVSLPIPASDPDLDTLTWSAAGLPPGLAIDPSTGLIEGTVSFEAAAGSPYAVTVTVTDDRAPNLADEAAFSWLVADTNRAPVVTPVSDRISDEGDGISLSVAGADPDADVITWSATGLPTGLGIDPATGIISGAIAFTAADSSPYTVMVTATDDGTPSLWTTVVFGWTVDDVNRAPVLAGPTDRASAEGEAVALAIEASDPDGDTLTWSASGLPAGLSIDPATGVVGGTISHNAAAASPYTVTVTVTDDRAPHLSDGAVFAWSVANTNRAPVVTDPGDQTAAEDEIASLAVIGGDPDGDHLAWSAAGLPPGLSIDPSTGVITGTASVPGVFSVTVTATDDGAPSLSASVGFSWIVVAAAPAAPVIAPLPDRSDLVGASVTIQPVGTSPDGETLAWSATGLPAGITIDPGAGEVSGTLGGAGVFEVAVTVTDGRGLTATAGFVWTVGEGLPEDEPPRAEDDVFSVIETDLDDGAVLLSVLDNDIDPEGTGLRVTWLGEVPVGEAAIDGDSIIVYRPPADWLGTTGFSYVVADAAGNTDTATVTVTVIPDLDRRAAGTALIWESSEESRPTSVIGTIRSPEAQLVFGSIIQSLHVLRMPLALLGGAVIWSLLLGGAFNLTLLLRGGVPFLSRRARMHLAIVMARHGQKVPAHVDPAEGEVVHRFVATAKAVAGTGRIHTVDDVEWAEVETPGGRGWVEAIHLTEHVDGDTFAEDPVPERMLSEFVERLRNRGDLRPFVSRYGLWVSHHDDPVHYPPEQIEGLTTSAEVRVWRGRNPAFPDVGGTFSDVVAAGIITAWDRPGRVIEVDRASVPSTIIPIEYTNFHALSIGAHLTGRDRLDQTAWLAHFSYEGNTPYLIALTREG